MKWIISASKRSNLIQLSVLATFILTSSSTAFAHQHKHKHKKHHHHVVTPIVYKDYYKDQPLAVMAPMFVPSWYVGFHVGESRTHDQAQPGSGDSVTQIGPGWTADLGYQFLQYQRLTLAGELGYTQYHNSNETTPGVNVASTEHFASYLAAVGQFSLAHNFNVLGKVGVAYSYAKKVFTGGASGSANAYSLYWGGGLSYNITQQAALVAQWARVRGNGSTGSTDLTSLGVSYSFL